MNLARWLRPLAARLGYRRNRAHDRLPPPRPVFRPQVEGLEDRIVPAVFTVTSTADTGSGSLRQAILDANSTGTGTPANPDLIQFAIPASDPGHVYYRNDGVSGQLTMANVVQTTADDDTAIGDIDPDYAHSWWRIQPASQLPATAGPVVIDGYTQGAGTNQAAQPGIIGGRILRIELDGSAIGPTNPLAGVTLAGGGSTVRGLNVNRFVGGLESGVGIQAQGAGTNTIQGNYIGTDISGTRLAGNPPASNSDPTAMWTGINVDGTSDNNLVGTDGDGVSDEAEGNLVCGIGAGIVLRGPGSENVSVGGHNVVAGNTVGPGASGSLTYSDNGTTQRMGNIIGISTLLYAHHDQIGISTAGTVPRGAGNLISGNVLGYIPGGGFQLAAEAFGEIAGNTITHNAHVGIGIAIASDSVLITENEIAYNGIVGGTQYDNAAGVWVTDFRGAPTGIRIVGNSIHDNTGLGIDLGGNVSGQLFTWAQLPAGTGPNGVTVNDSVGHTGPNHNQNFPVLVSAAVTGTSTDAVGTLTGPAGGTYRIEFFANSQPGHPNTNNPGDSNLYGEGETFLGARDVMIGADGTAYILATDLAPIPPGGAYLTATATNKATGDTSEFSATLPAPAAGGGITLQATTQQAADDIVAAVNGMSPPVQPVTVTVNLGGGNFTGITASPPANVTLVFENGTFNGHSPALTVTSGAVIVLNSTLTNATDAPTILVTGGHLTLRNDVIQESTGFAQVAVQVTGGAVDLGTVGDPGGNTLNVNGDGTLIADTGTSPVSAIGNTWQANSTTLTSPAAIAVLVSGPVVVKATPTVAVMGGSFIYDGQPHPATGSVTGVNGENLGTPAFTYSYTDDTGNVVTSSDAPLDPGYYTVTASFAGSGDYFSTSATATIAIVFEVRTSTDLSKAFHAGRTIPIKIELLDAAGNDVSSAGIDLTALRLERVNADGTTTQVALQDAGGSNPDNLFRYDASLGGYVFNLSTKGLAAGSYNFYWLDDADNTTHELNFQLV